MQEKMNDEIINSEIGSFEKLMDGAKKNMELGKTNNFTIAQFKKGEIIEIRGLKFKIKTINDKKKTMFIKML